MASTRLLSARSRSTARACSRRFARRRGRSMDLTNFARYPSLRDKTVFVTGGGSGIGAAVVESFVDQGARVAFVDIEDEWSRRLCQDLKQQYGTAPQYIRCDIRDVTALQSTIDKIGRDLGDIGVLVNNAANDMRHDWTTVTPDYWDDRMAINLRPMFFTVQSVIPQMKRLGSGSIINFGSVSWKLAQGGMPAYTSAKAAVHGLTRGSCPRLRQGRHQGQYGGARLGDDRKTAQALGHARGREADRSGSMSQRQGPARRPRAHGAVPGIG